LLAMLAGLERHPYRMCSSVEQAAVPVEIKRRGLH
jgi:hypothetical protein